jgi:flagellar motor switch protein FliM
MLNETSSKKSRNQELQVLLGGAHVNLEVNLGYAQLSLQELLEVEEGDILRLNLPADDVVSISIDGKERFIAQMGLRRFRKSVQITQLIDTEKDAVKRALKEFEMKRKERIVGVKEIIKIRDEYDEGEQ